MNYMNYFTMLRKMLESSELGNVAEKISARSANDYDLIKDQLILRPLNYNLHAKELQDAVYEREGDIAIVLYQLLSNSSSSLMTSEINRREVEAWGKLDSLEEVFRDAMKNTMKLFPAAVCNYGNGCEDADFLKTEFNSIDEITSPVGTILLSTSKAANGALAIFYPGVREKLHQLLGDDFYVVFMNVNDVMIVPKNQQALARLFLRSAKSGNDMGEMLSQSLFLSDKRGLNPKK